MEALCIRLCDTLSDFYTENDRITKCTSPKIFVALSPASDNLLTPDVSQNSRYLLPEWKCPDEQSSLERVHLVMMPQSMSWMCGRMPVLFYRQADDPRHIYKQVAGDLQRLFNVLHPQSRMETVFFTSLENASVALPDARVCQMLPTDELAQHFQHTIEPDTFYYLLTKRALALSGISTPPTHVIEFGAREIGLNDSDLDAVVEDTLHKIRARKIPFVLKTNYCAGGRSTFLVRDQADHARLLQQTAKSLKKDLKKLTVSNVNLHPCDLVLQDMVADMKTYGINFYVYSDSHHRIASCTEQQVSETNHWAGSIIDYAQQDELRQRFADITAQAAGFLIANGYHGPAGIDVMRSTSGALQVVDLNSRPTSTIMLGCFRDHFVDNLCYTAATILPTLQFLGTYDDLLAAFFPRLTRGEIVVVSWCTELNPTRSSFCVVAGAPSRQVLNQLTSQIKAWADCSWSDASN